MRPRPPRRYDVCPRPPIKYTDSRTSARKHDIARLPQWYTHTHTHVRIYKVAGSLARRLDITLRARAFQGEKSLTAPCVKRKKIYIRRCFSIIRIHRLLPFRYILFIRAAASLSRLLFINVLRRLSGFLSLCLGPRVSASMCSIARARAALM